MATLTELQKQGIGDLIQDWPIEPLIDYNRVRSMKDYYGSIPYDEDTGGFVLNPGSSVADPSKGPPLGLSRAYGTDPFIYIRDLEKFQPEWTPGATQEGQFNELLAQEIGHEARHHEFIENPELLEDLNIPALEGKGHVAHETYNAYLDAVARGNVGTKGFPMNREFYKFITSQKKPGEGVWGIRGLSDLFDNMKTKYMKHVTPRAGPQAPIGRPIRPGGGEAWSPSGADLSPGGGYGQSPTGRDIAGTPFSDGGLATMFQRR
jgi:hypothetical protein